MSAITELVSDSGRATFPNEFSALPDRAKFLWCGAGIFLTLKGGLSRVL